jgi:hypothetical protein
MRRGQQCLWVPDEARAPHLEPGGLLGRARPQLCQLGAPLRQLRLDRLHLRGQRRALRLEGLAAPLQLARVGGLQVKVLLRAREAQLDERVLLAPAVHLQAQLVVFKVCLAEVLLERRDLLRTERGG